MTLGPASQQCPVPELVTLSDPFLGSQLAFGGTGVSVETYNVIVVTNVWSCFSAKGVGILTISPKNTVINKE